MKKFLSAVLALAILIVPVGALSSFAAGGSDGSLGSMLRLMGVQKVKTVIIVDKEGNYTTRLELFGKSGKSLGSEPWPEMTNPVIEAKLAEMRILQTIRDLKCDKAVITFEGDDSNFQFLHENFYNLKGELVKSKKYRTPNKGMLLF